MVPTRYFMLEPASLMMASAVSTTTFFTYASSLTSPTRGDHDLRHHGPLGMLGLDVQRGLDDGAGLHGGDLRIGDRQTAAPVTHHGVELVQAGDDGLDLRNALAHVLGQRLDVGLLSGHELVRRGIQETDGDRQALHSLIDALEVGLLA